MDIVKEYSSSLKTAERCMIDCSSALSDKCKKRYEAGVQSIRENMKKNNGNYICRSCATFIKSQKNIAKRNEEKKNFVSSKLADILNARRFKPLSGKVGTCSATNHDTAARNCIPPYPYNRVSVPVEDFISDKNPSKIYNMCLGCREYRSQCLNFTNAKRENESTVPNCKTCICSSHAVASKLPRENIPVEYFRENMNDANSKIGKKCWDCRQHIKNTEEKRIVKITENGGIYCVDCKVEKTLDLMFIRKDGSMSKCKKCTERYSEYWKKRYDELMVHQRQLQLDRIIENECSCEVCKCIFIKPSEGEFICTKLQTRNENGLNLIDYKGKTFPVKDFLSQYSHLLEFRILDFDHLPTDDPSMQKLYSVCRAKTKENMTLEASKCQLVDCECHIRETIKREKGRLSYGELSKKKDIVNNVKRKGCSFCGYKAENDEMLRFIHLDHIDPTAKIASVSTMINDYNCSIDNVYREMEKCRPLCAFCHRIYTFYFYGSSYVESFESFPDLIEYEN